MKIYKKLSNFFEIRHQKKIEKYLKKKDINFFIDVGAYEGNFLNNLNNKNIKNAFFFEPNTKQFTKLKKKLKKFSIHKFAISNKVKSSKFLINTNQVTTSTLEDVLDKRNFLFFLKTKILGMNYDKSIVIKTNTLDNFFKDKKIKKKSLLKIDTEGNDLNVLKGGKKTLKNIKYVIIECKKFNFYKNNSKLEIERFMLNKKFKQIKIFSTFPFIYQDILYENKYIK